MERQYALKWNDFHVKLTSSFQHLRNEFDFIDVTLAGDGYSFSAHKVILSACSPYFRQLLKANPCQHPIIILRDVNKQNMENLLMFMYNGEVNLEHEQLADFIKAAQLLKIRGLADIKDSFAQLGNDSFENISSPTPPVQEKFTPSTSTYERPTIPEPEPELIIPNMITEPDPHSMEAPSSSHSHEPELIDQKISIADLIEPKQEPIEIIDEDLSLEDVCSVEDISNMSSMSNQSYNDPNNETATTSNLSLPGSSDQKRPRIEGPTRHVVRKGSSRKSSYQIAQLQCQCGYIAATPAKLRKHTYIKHNPNRPTFACDFCGNTYSTQSNLKSHVDNVHVEVPIEHWPKCQHCAKKFKTQHYLTVHEYQAHSIRKFKKY